MIPTEISDALNQLFGDYAQYVIILLVLVPFAPRFAKSATEMLDFLPKQREARAKTKRLSLAERLLALDKAQKETGVELIDVKKYWDDGDDPGDRFRNYSLVLPQTPPEDRPKANYYPSPLRVFNNSMLPWIFGFLYGVLPFAGLILFMQEFFPDTAEIRLFGPAVIAYLIAPFAAVFWCVAKLDPAHWRRGFLHVQGKIILKMLWLLPALMIGGTILLMVAGHLFI